MTRRALVFQNNVVGFSDAPLSDGDRTTPSDTKPHLSPLEVDRPEYDPVSQILTGPVFEIEPDRVVERYLIAPRPLDERKAGMIAAVLIERTTRLAAGFDYDFGDARGTHRIGTTDADLVGWDEVSKVAGAMINLGSGAETITIVTDTGPAVITAQEWQAILVAAAAFRQPIWANSFALQAAIADAAGHVALDGIDISAGW